MSISKKEEKQKAKDICILILEDVATDAEIIEIELRKGGITFIPKRVATQKAFLKALEEFQPDLILADYSLPQFDGLSALRIAKEKYPEVPFLLVSGAIGEELAIEMLKQGATDYILKSNLQRLVPAVERALHEAKQNAKREVTEKALRESEEKYRNVVERANDGITIIQDGIVKFANKRLAELWGGSVMEVLGTPFADYLHHEVLDEVEDRYKRRMAGEDVSPIYETELKRRDGSKASAELNSGIIVYSGKPANLVIVRDISERKKAEKALADEANRRRILMEQSRDGIVILDQNGRVYEANRQFAAMLGYSLKEVQDLNVWDWDCQWTKEQLLEMTRNVDATGDHFETRHRRKDGSIYDVEISTNGAVLDGQKLVFCVCRDISERKAAEKALRQSEERLRVLMVNLPGMAYRCLNAPGWPMEFVSEGCRALTGYEPEEFMGKDAIPFENIIHPDDRKDIYDKLQEQIGAGRKFHLEYRLTTKQGEEKYVWEQGQLITGYGEDHQWLEGFIMDITEHRRAEIALVESEAELHDAYFSEAALNMILSESLQRQTLEEFLQKSLNMILSIPWIPLQPIGSISLVEDDKDTLVMKAQSNLPDKLKKLCSRISFGQCLCGNAALSQEIQFASHIDEQHEICCDEIMPHGHYAVPILFGGKTLGVINLYLKEDHIRKKKEEELLNSLADTLSGIIIRKKAEDRIQYLAYYDALTGLPKRNLFLDRLTQWIARAEYSRKLVAVMAVDIDRFKSINEVYGIDAGDAVLQEVARRILSSIRDGDTVARLGNDDFGVLLIDIADSSDIIMVIEKIMKTVSHPIQFDGKEIMLTLSAGISVFSDDGTDAPSLIKSADLAIARAKQQGRKNYQFYTQDMDTKAAEFVQMEKNLFNAIQNKEFLLHYQPYRDINTRKMVGMEALIRWKSPEEGLVPPGKFIPVLEETRMIIDVGEWILRTAVRQVKEWQNKGYPVVPVSVNLSLIQFRQKDLSEMIKKIIMESGCYPSLLTLEITESAFIHDIELTYRVLAELKKIGIRISIDDFGTGYSSLAHLKRFPVDNLKIDMSFIKEIATDPDTASIVTAIIAMAHTLNLKTIAEGIETEEQWKVLRLLRCHMGQGYYFSMPLPAEEMEKLLIGNTDDKQAKT